MHTTDQLQEACQDAMRFAIEDPISAQKIIDKKTVLVRFNVPDEAGEAVATAYLAFQAAGFVNPRAAIDSVAHFLYDEGLGEEVDSDGLFIESSIPNK